MADKNTDKNSSKREQGKEIRKDYGQGNTAKKPINVTPTFQAPDPPAKPKK